MTSRRFQSPLLIVGTLLFGILLGQAGQQTVPAAFQAPKTAATPALTMEMRIGSNLYLQTSAEYQAACLQTYRCAADRLLQLQPSIDFNDRPSAVIMDLDETVFDNSSFQTFLYQTRQEYTDELWANYEENYDEDVTLIPGVKRFIEHATKLGVTVVFLSNRLEKYQPSTIAALERLGVAGEKVGERLFLKKDGQGSNKTERRAQVAEKYDVLMLIGDNLRDFSEDFALPKLTDPPATNDILQAVAHRKSEVGRLSGHFGQDWFILPNPVYGEWDKAVKVAPLELMHPTTMPTK